MKAFVAGDVPQLYLLKGEVEGRLATPDDQVLWKGLGIRAEREFAAGDTVEATQSNKDNALEFLAGDLSREVLRRVALAMTARPE